MVKKTGKPKRCVKCSYRWAYKGKRRVGAFITCPNCHTSQKL